MKHVILTMILTLMSTSVAFCDTGVFRVSATVPRIIGVNYFPESADLAPSRNDEEQPKITVKQLVFRDGEEIVLETSVVK